MTSEIRTGLAIRQSKSAQWLRIVGLGGLLLAFGVFVWQLPFFLEGNSVVWPQYANAFEDMLFYTAWTFAILLVATAFSRTVSIRTLLAFWLLGVFAIHGLLVAIGTPFIASLGTNGVGIWVAPVAQMIVVSVAIVLFYLLATVGRATHPTVSDGMLVGFAMGAGVGFHEEMTYARLLPIGPGAKYGSVGNLGQDIWWSYVFPLVGWQASFNIRQFGNGLVGAFTLYHAGWGTLLGAGIGLAYVNRHRLIAWVAAVIAMAVTYFEHMSNNWRTMNSNEPIPLVGELFVGGDIRGASELAVYILLFAIAAAIVFDLYILRRTGQIYDSFPPIGIGVVRRVTGHANGSGSLVSRLYGLTSYTRIRRATLMGLYRATSTDRVPANLTISFQRLSVLGDRAGIWSALRESGELTDPNAARRSDRL